MKISNILLSLLIAFTLASCSSSGEGNDSAAAADSAEVFDPVQVTNEARTAARRLADVPATDTMAMQDALLRARAEQSRYVSAGDKAMAEVYDTAFIHTLRAVRPDIAATIEALPESGK